MKTILAFALVSGLCSLAGAQNNTPAAQPAPVVTAPAAPAAPAQPEKKLTLEELKKKHIGAVADLKKKHVDELKAFRDTLKGKTPEEKKKAIEAKKAEFKAAVAELQKANKAEIEQFKKDNPKPSKKDLMQKVKNGLPKP
jgi:hypothetical protein